MNIINKCKKTITKTIFIIPSLIALGAVAVYPLIYAIRSSFHDWNLHRPDASRFIGINNYIRLFNDFTFTNSLTITLIYTLITVTGTMVLGFLLALLLQKPFKGVNLARALLTVPMIMTQVVIGLGFRVFIWEPDYGLVNWLLDLINISGPAWVSQIPYAFIAAAITHIWFMTPLVMIIMDASLANIPDNIQDATKIDGASYWQRIFYVIIPMLKKTIIFTILLRITIDFRMFDIIHVLTGGGPGRSTQLLSVWVYNQALRAHNLGYANSGALLMMVIIALICGTITYWGLLKGGPES